MEIILKKILTKAILVATMVTCSMSVQAQDPTYGADSSWKYVTFTTENCGGSGGGPNPL